MTSRDFPCNFLSNKDLKRTLLDKINMNPYVAIVNQKISLCRILLSEGMLKNKLSEKKTDAQVELAFIQSAVYQLESAYINYLKEIAFAHKCKDIKSVDSLQKLKTELLFANKSTAESQEIELLLGEQQSWLSQLLNEYKKLSLPPLTISKKNNDNSVSLLEVKQLDDMMYLDFYLIEKWVNSFNEILDRNRQLMHEC